MVGARIQNSHLQRSFDALRNVFPAIGLGVATHRLRTMSAWSRSDIFRFATFKRCNLVRSTHCCKEFPSKIPWRNIGALLAYTRLNVKVETAGVGAELAQVDASSAAFFPDLRVSKLWCLGDC